MYMCIFVTYYGIDCFGMLLNILLFIEKVPFVIIDYSRQNESVKRVTVDAHYEDVESFSNLNSYNTMRCGRHAKNCAL